MPLTSAADGSQKTCLGFAQAGHPHVCFTICTRVSEDASYIGMTAKLAALVIVLSSVFVFTGCNACFNKPANPDQLREQTAQATAEAKNDAKAVAEGVRDGLRRSSNDNAVDLNSASKSELESLPGISENLADRIMNGRPYDSTHQLVDKKILSREQYDKLADRVTVRK